MNDTDPHANNGSRARDHLANERTFLAWVRTALGALALGIAVERFGADEGDASVVVFAIVLMAMGIGVLAMATVRYFTVARDLDNGRFHVDRRSPLVVLAGAGVLAVLSLVLFIV